MLEEAEGADLKLLTGEAAAGAVFTLAAAGLGDEAAGEAEVPSFFAAASRFFLIISAKPPPFGAAPPPPIMALSWDANPPPAAGFAAGEVVAPPPPPPPLATTCPANAGVLLSTVTVFFSLAPPYDIAPSTV